MSEQLQERKKPGPKPKLPKVSILDRRLANPFGAGSAPITLKTPGRWEVRYVYADLRPGRLHDMTRNKGWVFVEASELDGTPDEYGLIEKQGRLVRGEHGAEVLMKMPKADFDAIQQAKARLNLKGLGKDALRQSTAQDAAKKMGSEAGDKVYESFDRIHVTDVRGVDPELEAEEA